MSYERYMQDVLRMLDGIAPLMEQISHDRSYYEELLSSRETLRQIESFSGVSGELHGSVGALPRADELARNLRTFHESISDWDHVLATSQALENAIRPLPDLAGFYDAQFAYSQHVGNFAQALNSAIASAGFVAEIELSESEDDRGSKKDPAKEAEEKLIEEAPAGYLENLRRVDFVPIALLDRALRNPEAMRSFSPRDFEDFIAELTEGLGFEDVMVTPRSGDKGRDVLATKRVHGIPILFAFECKRFAPSCPVGIEYARALLGVIDHCETRANKGVLVTTSRFTKGATRFILTEPSLDSRDFEGVVGWLHDYAAKRGHG